MDFIRKFDIELDKEIYYAGEVLSGRIIVQNTENIRVQGIRVHFRGKAHAEWRINRAGERRTIKQDEHYIDERKSVWGKDRNEEGPIPILPRGNHKYPFEYKLPESALPCSFESKIGTIRYYIRVTIDIPYASCPQGIKYFTVVGPHIDCMDERFLSPTNVESKRYNCSLCCGKGPLSMKATLERSAYCCGENVKLKVEIQNGSDEEVWVMVRMIQNVEYFINRGVLGISKELRHTVIQVESPHIEPHTTIMLDDLHNQLQVPIMPPTMVEVCGLIQIWYSLKISLRTEKSGDCLEAEMPVTIATVPFRIPSNPIPEIQYDVAADYVEGGMYISLEFQLGQVYMGEDEDSDSDKEILYRPIYVCVPHIRPTPRHKIRAATNIRRSASPTPTDNMLLLTPSGQRRKDAQEELSESDCASVHLDKDCVRIQIIRDTPDEGCSFSDTDLLVSKTDKRETPVKEVSIHRSSEDISVLKQIHVSNVTTSSEIGDHVSDNTKGKTLIIQNTADITDGKMLSKDTAAFNTNKAPPSSHSKDVPAGEESIPNGAAVTKSTNESIPNTQFSTDSPKDTRSLMTKSKTTFREVHESSTSVLVTTKETVKVKGVVVSSNESQEQEFQTSKSEDTHTETTTGQAQKLRSTPPDAKQELQSTAKARVTVPTCSDIQNDEVSSAASQKNGSALADTSDVAAAPKAESQPDVAAQNIQHESASAQGSQHC